jgi:hypothetical protein
MGEFVAMVWGLFNVLNNVDHELCYSDYIYFIQLDFFFFFFFK